MTDDLITLRTVRGSVEVGLNRAGADAILEELRARRALAPLPLTGAYRDVEDAIERLLSDLDVSPTPSPSGIASPSASSPPTVTPTPSPTVGASVSAAVDNAADQLSEWLRSNCNAP
ncbi:MAG: hypothetical protein FJW64_03875 [Actinobacteria bacterium]|nr:hypothetical protein [Actinomycetota bacterium]